MGPSTRGVYACQQPALGARIRRGRGDPRERHPTGSLPCCPLPPQPPTSIRTLCSCSLPCASCFGHQQRARCPAPTAPPCARNPGAPVGDRASRKAEGGRSAAWAAVPVPSCCGSGSQAATLCWCPALSPALLFFHLDPSWHHLCFTSWDFSLGPFPRRLLLNRINNMFILLFVLLKLLNNSLF